MFLKPAAAREEHCKITHSVKSKMDGITVTLTHLLPKKGTSRSFGCDATPVEAIAEAAISELFNNMTCKTRKGIRPKL